MPRRRDPAAGQVVHRTARVGLRLTRGQRQRCFGLLRAAGDVWACVLEVNAWRYRRQDRPAASYQELCRLLAPDPQRVAGVDLGIIHPYAVAATDGPALLASGRAIRAEHRQHLADW